MNKEYITFGKDLFVINDEGNMKRMPNNENSLKKIQLENDLEELEKMRNQWSNRIYSGESSLTIGLVAVIVGGILSALFLSYGINLIAIAFALLPLILTFSGFMCFYEHFSLKRKNKNILMELNHIKKTIDEVTKEKEALEKEEVVDKVITDEDASNKSNDVVINKVIDSRTMEMLNHDLELIWFYQKCKKEILKDYKDGVLISWLKAMGYHLEDIYFMTSLIEKDLGINEEKGKSLVKK